MERATAPRGVWRDATVYLEPRLIAVLFMGFSSGLPLALTGATLQVWMARENVDLATIGFFVLVGIAYTLKFVWAPIMDRVTLPGPLGRLGRRRGWAILAQLGLMGTIVLLGTTDPVAAPALTALCAVLVAFCSASQDVVIDAYRIELLDEDQQGAGAAMTQYGYRVGTLVAVAGALFLHGDGERLSWPAVYLVMAAFVMVGVVTVLMTREPAALAPRREETARPGAHLMRTAVVCLLIAAAVVAFAILKFAIFAGVELPAWGKWVPNVLATVLAAATPIAIVALLPRPQAASGLAAGYAALRGWLDATFIDPFKDIARRDRWLLILVFIVLFKLGDATAGVISSAFYVTMEFSDDEIAPASKTFGLIATLVGVGLGGFLVARVGLMRALLVGGVLQMLSNLMFAAQSQVGHHFGFLTLTVAVENLSGGIGSAAFVAYLSLLCSVRFTGTHYALFTSLAAIGRTVLSAPGGWIAREIGWFDYFLVTTAVALPGLVLLIWMMRVLPPPSPNQSAGTT